MENNLGIYIRLSHATDEVGREKYESASITNQRTLIRDYLESHTEFSSWNLIEFVDDGFSGTSEQRPEFQRLLDMVKQGKIQCIIVKDFSRFARNYVMMGDYLEQIFPFLGVRFISVNDGYDSADKNSYTEDFSVVLKSILNSYYSKDLSAKMYTHFTQKMTSGEYTGSPCFGYSLDKEQNKFVIDPEAAKIVRRVYDLALTGMPRKQIAEKMNEEGHLTPALYRRAHGVKDFQTVSSNPLWTHNIVTKILREEKYTGTMILRRMVNVAPCSKSRRRTDASERIVHPNAHEGIVTKEEFDRVQELYPPRKGWDRKNQLQYPLKKRIRCGNCGKMMFLSRRTQRFGCPESASEYSTCTKNTFPRKEIEQLVLETLHNSFPAILREERLQKRQLSSSGKQMEQIRRELEATQQEIKKFVSSKVALYEQYVEGQITLEEYTARKDELTKKNQEAQERETLLRDQQTSAAYSSVSSDLRLSADGANRFYSLQELTEDMVNTFIDTVFIFENHIEIRWKYQPLMEQIAPDATTPIPFKEEAQ